MTDDRKPFFRFYPTAYDHGTFVEDDQPCHVCNRPCVWRYTEYFTILGDDGEDVEPAICASCISDGSLAEKYSSDAYFTLHDQCCWYTDVDEEYEKEIWQRTPGFFTWNPCEWPLLEGKPMAFMHTYMPDEAHIFEDPKVMEAVSHAFETYGGGNTSLPKYQKYPLQYVLLFKELDGDRWRASIDYD